MRHHAILITTWNDDRFEQLSDKVHAIFKEDSYAEAAAAQFNSYHTMLIPPDGSKEGWPESDKHDRYRDELIEWLKTQHHADGSSWFSWVEVQYGDDEGQTCILRDSDEEKRTPETTGRESK